MITATLHKRLLFAVCACLWLGTNQSVAQIEVITIPEARVALKQAIQQGNLTQADNIITALFQVNPDDFDALAGEAIVALTRKDMPKARAAAKAAHSIAPAQTKWQFARLVAQTHFEQGRLPLAQLWLRRAFNSAPDAKSKAAVAKEFQAVSKLNPLSIQLSFGITPSNNVNGGSNEKVFYLGGIPFELSADSLALSGVLVSAEANLKYKLSESQKQVTSLGINLSERQAYLSSNAKASAPTVKNGDYTFASKEVYIEHRRLIFPKLGSTDFSVLAGKNWYGGEPLWDYRRLTIGQTFSIDKTSSAYLRVIKQQDFAQRASDTNTEYADVDLTYSTRVFSADRISFNLGKRWTQSTAQSSENDWSRIKLTYSLGRKVLGTGLSFSWGADRRDYDVYGLSIDGRHDKSVSLGVNAIFQDVSYFGFSPSLSIDAKRTYSNVSRFSSESVSAGFGWQSNF